MKGSDPCQAASPGGVGKTYPSEKFVFRDPQTGAEITQYTGLGNNRTLYFTNRPYTCDGGHLVFYSDRTGQSEVHLLEVATGKIIQVTDLSGQLVVDACLHPARPELYFHDQHSIWRVNIETLRSEELLRAPEGFVFGILNLNSPPWLAFDLRETSGKVTRIVDGKPVTHKGWNIESILMRPRAVICRLDVDTGQFDPLWSDLKAFTHVQVSPVNPDLLIFSNSSRYGEDRVMYLNLKDRFKPAPRPLLHEGADCRGGHECFTRRGNLALQWISSSRTAEGRSYQQMHAFKMLEKTPIEQVEEAELKTFAIPGNEPFMQHHFTMSGDEAWGVHDRWPSGATEDEKGNHLSLFRHCESEPQTGFVPICRHDSDRGGNGPLGPNLTIDDNDEFATYTSYLNGGINICQVRLEPFLEKRTRNP